MHFDYIFSSVAILYAKVLGICSAFYISKYYTAQHRSSTKPPMKEKLWRYGSFISIALAIGIMVSDRYKGDDDNGHYVTDYNRGAIVFIVVLIPILFGISDGFTTDDERFTKPPSHTDDDDY